MLDDLRKIIRTSKSGHSYIRDTDVLNAQLHDMVDRYGYEAMTAYLQGWLRGKGRAEKEKPYPCPVCGSPCRVVQDDQDETEVSVYYQCSSPDCKWDERNI